MLHPVNSYHLIIRTAKWLPKLKREIPHLKFDFPFPSEEDSLVGAVHGLADIQEYYDFKVDDLMKGHITDFEGSNGGKKRLFYKANKGLTSDDALAVANDALRSNYLHGYVEWLKGALKQAKAEERPAKHLSKIK